MENKIYFDKNYLLHMATKWGINILAKKSSRKALKAGLDSTYFFTEDTTNY